MTSSAPCSPDASFFSTFDHDSINEAGVKPFCRITSRCGSKILSTGSYSVLKPGYVLQLLGIVRRHFLIAAHDELLGFRSKRLEHGPDRQVFHADRVF